MDRKVVFVTPTGQRQLSGSTILRSVQLRQLVAPLLDVPGVETSVGPGMDARDSVLVLSKYVLLGKRAAEIKRLKRRGNVVCADPLDARVPDIVLASCDVLIASSRLQHKALTQCFPQLPVAYVAHHVDLRMDAVSAPGDCFRLGYLGEPVNAGFADDVSDLVTFVRTNTSNAGDTTWMRRLSEFNAHYAVRTRQSRDGFKPFTKGFVAAHCNCPVLVQDDDNEARMFLPPDYPFFTAASSAEKIREAILGMQSSFGSQDWRRAVSAMQEVKAASSHQAVAQQMYEAVGMAMALPRRKSLLFRPTRPWTLWAD